ncbi:MAG: 5-formyltetrahydrofolate cyclo-ligase [Burkholderiales bacterium]|nr:MAG: 5-formyltetrahydrofolate cyclo-ligase [Burkholderiales bacterium]
MDIVDDKRKLRERLKQKRRDHVTSLPDAVRRLIFHRPPSGVAALMEPGAIIGLYHAGPFEAPTLPYAKWYHENGYRLALPWFADRGSPMAFRLWPDPYDTDALETGPFSVLQPLSDSESIAPDLVFVPLIGFTVAGDRLGQGGGHYDRWLGANPNATAIGLAWDCQLLESLPTEAHDAKLDMVVTPTRAFEVKR